MKHLTPEPPRWLILSKALEETRSENRKLTGRLEKRDERIRALEAGLREIVEDHWRVGWAVNLTTSNPNLRYCVQFLRNGGERLRAVKLVCDTTGLGIREAVKFVDGLHEPVPLAGQTNPRQF